jgi:hypothetical protein
MRDDVFVNTATKHRRGLDAYRDTVHKPSGYRHRHSAAGQEGPTIEWRRYRHDKGTEPRTQIKRCFMILFSVECLSVELVDLKLCELS